MSATTGIIVPGPAQVFVQTGASAAWEFLGWSERGVTPRFRPLWRDVQADYAGDAPADVMYAGQEASVAMSLVKYSETVLQKLMHWLANATSITAGQLLGSDPAGTTQPIGIGTLMNAEGASVGLVIQSTYASRPNNTAYGMMPGVYFYSALPQESEVPHSMAARVVPLNFRCVPVFNPSAGTAQCFTTSLPTGLVVS